MLLLKILQWLLLLLGKGHSAGAYERHCRTWPVLPHHTASGLAYVQLSLLESDPHAFPWVPQITALLLRRPPQLWESLLCSPGHGGSFLFTQWQVAPCFHSSLQAMPGMGRGRAYKYSLNEQASQYTYRTRRLAG